MGCQSHKSTERCGTRTNAAGCGALVVRHADGQTMDDEVLLVGACKATTGTASARGQWGVDRRVRLGSVGDEQPSPHLEHDGWYASASGQCGPKGETRKVEKETEEKRQGTSGNGVLVF